MYSFKEKKLHYNRLQNQSAASAESEAFTEY